MKVNIKIKLVVFLCAFIAIFANNTKYVFANNNDYIIETKDEMYMPNKVWDISFTTQLDKSTVNSKNIYVIDSKDRRVENIELKYDEGKKIVKVIPSKEYEQGKTYYLCLEKGIKSSKGREIKSSRKLEFKIKIIDSDFFKIRNVECISNNILNIYFTQPINKDAELPLYYEIYKNNQLYIRGSYQTMNIKVIDGSKNGLSIYLKDDKLNTYDEYSLKIFGDLMSDFSCRLLNGMGQQINFKGNDKEIEQLEVIDIQAVSQNIIRVTFNNSADKTLLSRVENYSLKDSNGTSKVISKAITTGDGKAVDLYVSNNLKNTFEYELSIKAIKDQYNLTTVKTKEYKIIFDNSQDLALHIVNVVPYDTKTLSVYFDKNISKGTAATTAFYRIAALDGTSFIDNPKSVYFNAELEPNMVKLYLNRELKGNKDYKLTVSSYLKDEFGNSIPNDESFQFMGTDEKYLGNYINNTVIIGNDHIKVNFNREISNGGVNLDKNNYVLECNQGENRKITIGCSEVKFVDYTTVILKFDNLDFKEYYTLKINSLVDLLGESTNTYSKGVPVDMGRE